MEGYILVASILILSGLIATVGDRLGTRVGKARLSLFGLRPRKTAVVITILTGGVISASSLGILFLFSESIRQRFFEFEEIKKGLEESRKEIQATTAQKATIEADRDRAKIDLVNTQSALTEINRSLQEAKKEQALTEEQLSTAEAKAEQLRAEVASLRQEQANLIEQRDQVKAQIAQRDRDIQAQEEIIAQGEARLKELEAEQAFLAQEVQQLEQGYSRLLTGDVVLTRGEVLASSVIQVPTPDATGAVADQLLREANRFAVKQIRPGTEDPTEPVIQVSQADVAALMQQISDGREYVVRVLSAGNYIVGGNDRVLVSIESDANRVIFSPGDVIAKTTTDPATMDAPQIRQRLDLLLAASQFRAQRSGIVSDTVEIRIQSFVEFLEQVANYNQPLTIQAVASEPIKTIGPLRLQFIALADDQEVFRSDN
jgi:uncharacterized protein (DUF3084 family)